jgi:hypothetical protein
MVTQLGIRAMINFSALGFAFYFANYLIKYDNKYDGTGPIPLPSWKAYVEMQKKLGKEP